MASPDLLPRAAPRPGAIVKLCPADALRTGRRQWRPVRRAGLSVLHATGAALALSGAQQARKLPDVPRRALATLVA
jgi:hypothetical protein